MPLPGPRGVLVRVEAASINYVDRFVISGATRELGLITHDGPVGLGWDAVGRVESVGLDVRTVSSATASPGCAWPTTASTERSPNTSCCPRLRSRWYPTRSPRPSRIDRMNASPPPRLSPSSKSRVSAPCWSPEPPAPGGLAVEQAVTAGWTVTGLARASDQESVESRQARLVTELDGTTYDAVFDAAPLQFDGQLLKAAVLPSVAFGGTFCSVRWADWTIDAYFLVGGIIFAILAVRYRATSGRTTTRVIPPGRH